MGIDAAGPCRCLDAALGYSRDGLSVIPVRDDGTKAASVDWKRYQTAPPRAEQLRQWFAAGSRHGMAAVAGRVSGGIEMLEFEGRAVVEGLADQFRDLCQAAGLGDVLERVSQGCLHRSPSGGLHLVFRTEAPAASQHLARRPATAGELRDSSNERVKVLIETRGDGGYFIVPPSHGTTHRSGRPWELARGGLATAATITVEERDALYEVARSLDAMPAIEHQPVDQDQGERPGDRLNRRADASEWMEELLVDHGWTVVDRREGVVYLRRPGKERGISATIGRHPGLLYVFSTSTEFEAPRGYRPFGAYAILEHGGDFRAAARALSGEQLLEQIGAQDAPRVADSRTGFRLPYRTVREIAEETHPEPDWVVFGYIARQAITELDGKVKAAGKTTLLAWAVRAILAAAPFIGSPTAKTGVIWLTEQQPEPFREVLEGAGLLESGDGLLVLFRGDVSGRPWPDVIGGMCADALERGYGLLIVDTLGKLAGVRDENDAAEWARAMTPLQDAAHRGLAVVVARHDRKSGGQIGDSGRGSSQVSGDVDIILRLGRPEGRHPPTYRLLEALSRYRVTSERAIINLTDEGYVPVGDEDAVELAAVMLSICDLLPTIGVDVWSEAKGMSEQELVTGVKRPRATVRRALARLLADGRIERTGNGRRGSAFRYWQRSEAGVSGDVSDQTSNPSRQGLITKTTPADQRQSITDNDENGLVGAAQQIFSEELA